MDFAPISKLAETTHGRNDPRPKRPTKLGRIDSAQNKAETTQGETTQPKRPMAETTRIPFARKCRYILLMVLVHNYSLPVW